MINKKRFNFDKFYLESLQIIKSISISEIDELKQIREMLKIEKNELDLKIKDVRIRESEKSFLRGRRKMITRLQSDSRRQLKIFNIALNNTPINSKGKCKWN